METSNKLTLLPILKYGLLFDKLRLEWVSIEATKYNEETNIPNTWAIRKGSFVMSKKTGEFDYEPRPSNRDNKFLKEYRFKSPEEAFKYWTKFQTK